MLKSRLGRRGGRAADTLALRDVDAQEQWMVEPVLEVLRYTAQPDLDTPGHGGYSAVQLAAASGCHLALRALLARGAHADDVAVGMARRNCDAETEQLLIARTTARTRPDIDGHEPELRCNIAAAMVGVTNAAVTAAQLAGWRLYNASGWPVESGGWDLAAGDHDPPELPRCSRVLPTVGIAEVTPRWAIETIRTAQSPVLVLNATAGWGLNARFRFDALLQNYSDQDLWVSDIPYGELYGKAAGHASFAEMLRYIIDGAGYDRESPPLYAFDSEVLEAVFAGEYGLPTGIQTVVGDWPVLAHQLVLGPTGAGAPWHFHEDAFNALVYGRKLWDIVPPGHAVFSSSRSDTVIHVPGATRQARGYWVPLPQDPGIRCVQLPGDLLYIPRGWGHRTLSLEAGVGLAIEADGGGCRSSLVARSCTHVVL